MVVNDGQEQAGLANQLNQRCPVLIVVVPFPVDVVLHTQRAQCVTSGADRVVIALLLEKFRCHGYEGAGIFNVERGNGRFTAAIRYFGTGPRQSDHLTSCRGFISVTLFCDILLLKNKKSLQRNDHHAGLASKLMNKVFAEAQKRKNPANARL